MKVCDQVSRNDVKHSQENGAIRSGLAPWRPIGIITVWARSPGPVSTSTPVPSRVNSFKLAFQC
ncbi:hypothetical protein DPMN_026168 [Dreissena polymorpha]|uniref:Uncharacterized protein n=1 Tax=Dreissena polymorpha TaxID=45954 RepID=A0A9D4RD80_DREPO|nr:hypothetical protein DPMN_026168 [Dreissena polymorpha]